MSLQTGFNIINESNLLGAQWISFTGGEPFLELDLLQRLVSYANSQGIRTEIVSNGSWASNLIEAEETLKKLKESGLEVLNLSLDDYHSEFIPVESVKNAYYAALNQEIKLVIMTSTSKNTKFTSSYIIKLLEDPKIQVLGKTCIQNPNALLIETQLTPVGRAQDIKNLDKKPIYEVRCTEPLRDIGIGPNGDVYPCCGPLSTEYSLGNITKTKLKKILQNAWEDPLFSSIHQGIKTLGEYSSKCHACLSLFKKLV
jgi:radical SAM protein with 4Fe4S-binding SPASM domain